KVSAMLPEWTSTCVDSDTSTKTSQSTKTHISGKTNTSASKPTQVTRLTELSSARWISSGCQTTRTATSAIPAASATFPGVFNWACNCSFDLPPERLKGWSNDHPFFSALNLCSPEFLPPQDSLAFAQNQQLIRVHILEGFHQPGWPSHFHQICLLGRTKPEVQPQIVL